MKKRRDYFPFGWIMLWGLHMEQVISILTWATLFQIPMSSSFCSTSIWNSKFTARISINQSMILVPKSIRLVQKFLLNLERMVLFWFSLSVICFPSISGALCGKRGLTQAMLGSWKMVHNGWLTTLISNLLVR